MLKRVIGLDLGVSTGLAIFEINDETHTIEPNEVGTFKAINNLTYVHHEGQFLCELYEFIHWQIINGVSHVFMEGYAFAAKGGREASGERGGMIRYVCHREHVPLTMIAPTQVSAWAYANTKDKEMAKDEAMLKAAYRELGMDNEFTPKNNHEADAYYLGKIGAHVAMRMPPPLEYQKKVYQAIVDSIEGNGAKPCRKVKTPK